MNAVRIVIPTDLDFATLQLTRRRDGAVSFDMSVITKIENASGLPPGYFLNAPEDAVSSLLVHWYGLHRASGGAADPTAEDLLAEVRAEDDRGNGLSHAAGQA